MNAILFLPRVLNLMQKLLSVKENGMTSTQVRLYLGVTAADISVSEIVSANTLNPFEKIANFFLKSSTIYFPVPVRTKVKTKGKVPAAISFTKIT